MGEVRARGARRANVSPAKVDVDKQRGWIVPVGGAEDKEGRAEILRRYVEISGGVAARIAIICGCSAFILSIHVEVAAIRFICA